MFTWNTRHEHVLVLLKVKGKILALSVIVPLWRNPLTKTVEVQATFFKDATRGREDKCFMKFLTKISRKLNLKAKLTLDLNVTYRNKEFREMVRVTRVSGRNAAWTCSFDVHKIYFSLSLLYLYIFLIENHLQTKDCMHNEVWGCAETLPKLLCEFCCYI